MPIVQCPRCQSELDVDEADIGHKVECPQCQAVFPAILDDDRGWRRRNDRPSYGNEYDPDDEYRRRDEYDPRDRTHDLQRAEAMIAKPANGLIWTAGITIVLGLIGAGIMAVLGIEMVNNGGIGQQGDGVALLFYAFCFGILSPIYHLVMLVGAQKAKKLEGSGWPTAAAIMGISTIALCGPCTIVSLFATGYGIWMLVTMSKPEVKRGLRWNAMAPPRHRGSPLEDDDALR
jgi:predicted Zn finger-like uncharacterized protein